MAALCMCRWRKSTVVISQPFSAILLMHLRKVGWGVREHDSPFFLFPAFDSASLALFLLLSLFPPRLALNLFWSPRFRLETRLPGVQVTSQFKPCQSSCFHFLLSSPHLNCLSACLSLSLSLSDFLPTPLPALVMRLIRWRVFCWSLSLSALMFICVTTICVFTSI